MSVPAGRVLTAVRGIEVKPPVSSTILFLNPPLLTDPGYATMGFNSARVGIVDKMLTKMTPQKLSARSYKNGIRARSGQVRWFSDVPPGDPRGFGGGVPELARDSD